jgi:DNA repair protein RecN (Recombination protein N)
MIKTGSKEAHIEAYFSNTSHPALEEIGIESSEGIIVRRSISSQGKGRAYINDISVSLQTLSTVVESLIDIHGQHEHQGLFKKDNHLLFLDTFGGLTENVASLKALYNEVVRLKSKVNELKERRLQRSQRIEFLMFQINEIDSANLKIGEKEAIEKEMKILINLAKLKESSEIAYSLLYGSEDSCFEKISHVVSRIKEMEHFDSSVKELLDVVESIVPQMEDASLLLRKLKDKYDTDPQRLTELDERLELIKRLQKKYGKGVDEILKYKEKAEKELQSLQHMDEECEFFEGELSVKEKKLQEMAEELSKMRELASKKMGKMISSELREVGFQNAVFKVDIKKKEAITPNGLDDVEFLFSANPGESPKPLIKVASGGELSRIMLAMKCIEINPYNSGLQALIFDEIDAGIGGVTAQHVGKRLNALAKNYQVLCITHLPQIAAFADNHMKVEKVVMKDRVKIGVEQLAGSKRQEELARMLSGTITDVSLKHAKELLGDSI